MPDPADDGVADRRDDEKSAKRGESSDEESLTAEFDILDADLDREVEPVESENPRDTLSPEELATHIEVLDSVAKARERARSAED